jgi:hypothetical protein
MSTSRVLEIDSVQRVLSVSYKGVRVSIRGGQSDVAARNLLSGSLADQPLTGTARRQGRVGDLVGTYWAGVYLVSERFRESVAELGASGWSTTPIQVPGVEVPLLLLSITGKCGPLFGVGGEQTEGGAAIGTFIDPQLWEGPTFSSHPTTIQSSSLAASPMRSSACVSQTLPSSPQVCKRFRDDRVLTAS